MLHHLTDFDLEDYVRSLSKLEKTKIKKKT